MRTKSCLTPRVLLSGCGAPKPQPAPESEPVLSGGSNPRAQVGTFGSVTPFPQYTATPFQPGDTQVAIPFNITAAGTYVVAMSFPDEATRSFYTAAAFKTTVSAGALDARGALAWDLPLVRPRPETPRGSKP